MGLLLVCGNGAEKGMLLFVTLKWRLPVTGISGLLGNMLSGLPTGESAGMSEGTMKFCNH
jgi:hypothetical protein